ncbi:hypothetical protein [Streptomyces sp. NPDC096012]|uniref:hypothetical protein n=1 Tax=Streptomyces sp. NPDC096012 TaxID=3155684 RepID=UPI00336A8C20
MDDGCGPSPEFPARIESAADAPYRARRTEGGVEPTVDVQAPQRREPLTRYRDGQVHTGQR